MIIVVLVLRRDWLPPEQTLRGGACDPGEYIIGYCLTRQYIITVVLEQYILSNHHHWVAYLLFLPQKTRWVLGFLTSKQKVGSGPSGLIWSWWGRALGGGGLAFRGSSPTSHLFPLPPTLSTFWGPQAEGSSWLFVGRGLASRGPNLVPQHCF